MRIIFQDKHIYDAPLDVLKHLYYYTVQYGLSVAQFTGKNPEYWRQLPYVLREKIGDEKALLKMIGELEKVSEKHDERLGKRREQMRSGWKGKEVVLNAQLDSVLLSLPTEILAEAFQNMAPMASGVVPSGYSVTSLAIEGEDADFVEPDLLLRGDDSLLMIELKTKGWKQSSRKYPAGQLLNYLRLVMEYQESGADEIKNFAHLILVPTDDLAWLERGDEWVKEYDKKTGRIVPDFDRCFDIAGKPSVIERRSREFVARYGKSIPVYYRSWEQMSGAFESVIGLRKHAQYHDHWQGIVAEMKELSVRASAFALEEKNNREEKSY